jgi:quercetin dioxygenase-like cupin family protein
VSGPVPVPRPEWSPLPRQGCVGVEAKVLLRSDELSLALLRFAPGATIDEHEARIDVDVVCVEGAGLVSVGEEQWPFAAGRTIRWPAGVLHRLWTEDETMTTLMVERG